MNLWIKILTSFFLLGLPLSYGCELVNKNIISLSGPVSTYLDQLKIINQVEAISVYHPVKNYSGRRLAGGLYLSTAELKNFAHKIVFYDKSRELKKVFNRFSEIKLIEIDSRKKTPFELIQIVKVALTPYLKECEQKISEIDKKVNELEKEIIEKISKIQESIFFLGPVGVKLPETIMSNDGFVYWLKKKDHLKSYPSQLEYLNWSMKILSPLRGHYFFFGIQDSYSDGVKSVEKISHKTYNVKYPGALTPGYTQLEFMKYLLDYF